MTQELYLPEEDATYEAAKNLTMIHEEQLDFAFNNLTKQQLIDRIFTGRTSIEVMHHEIDVNKINLELSRDDEFCFGVIFNSDFKDIIDHDECVNSKVKEMISSKLDDLASEYEYELKAV